MNTGATRRQARIVDWLKYPHGLDVVHGPAIDHTMACWTAQEIVDNANLGCSRAACLRDLSALRDRGVVWGGTRWRYLHPWEDGAPIV